MTRPEDLPLHEFLGAGGAKLVYREIGTGHPLILVHGYISNGWVNWIRYGHAAALAARGRRVIMPDLRGHGASSHPHDETSYPPDVLVDDGFALVEHLGLTDYDLGGYSLGARVTARMMIRGAKPRKAILAGAGLSGLADPRGSQAHFRRVLDNAEHHERGTQEWLAEAFLKTVHGDPIALRYVLDTFVETTPDDLARIEIPTLVLVGVDDKERETADQLANTLLHSHFRTIPGNHMGAVAHPELGTSIADFLDQG